MKVSLVVAQGPKQGTVIPVKGPEFVVGRDSSCQLRPNSQAVSKRHCALLQRGDKVYVQDLKSTNGTFVNRQPVQGERELRDGDQLDIGPLLFKVKLETAAQVPTQVEQKTRANAPASTPAPGEPLDEDAIGSMLLTLTDEGEPASGQGDDLDGTTIMQMLKPEEAQKLDDAKPYRPPSKQSAGDQNTSSAAKAILEKYRRRPRQ